MFMPQTKPDAADVDVCSHRISSGFEEGERRTEGSDRSHNRSPELHKRAWRERRGSAQGKNSTISTLETASA